MRVHAIQTGRVRIKASNTKSRRIGPRANPAAVHPRNLAPAQTLHWRDWYSLQSWRARAKHQLREHPLCTLCDEQGRVTPATIAGSQRRRGERLRRSAYRRPIAKTKRVTPTPINTGPTTPQTLVMFGSWNTCRTNSDMAVMKKPFMTQSVADHCVSQLRH